MEEDQELIKHVCKLCNKRFPCGRSLGGHMRSHLINDDKHTKKKILAAAYVLRENPKKNSRLVSESSSELDTLLTTNQQNKVCKECGKSFPSWKSLFGHMKCHSTRISSVEEEEEKDSWNSQSDSEAAAANYRKKRSSRKMKRYIAATLTSSTLTVDASSLICLSEINEKQQEEEVALSLIMLSTDVGNLVGLNPNGTIECSDANSQLLQTRSSNKSSKCKETELIKLKKVRNVKASFIPTEHKFLGDDNEKESTIMDNLYCTEIEIFSDQKEINSSKKRSIEKNEYSDSNKQKINKFECTTCNKSFHSYQGLGGHKASHKRFKGSDENNSSIEIHVNLQNPVAASKNIVKNCSKDSTIIEFGKANYVSKKQKVYECPICFKSFPSGQALGGHKRSHMIAEAKSNIDIEIEKPIIPEIRVLLDLNMPAPVEEESSTEHIEEFKSWWKVGNIHKHEQFVGLLSN